MRSDDNWVENERKKITRIETKFRIRCDAKADDLDLMDLVLSGP